MLLSLCVGDRKQTRVHCENNQAIKNKSLFYHIDSFLSVLSDHITGIKIIQLMTSPSKNEPPHDKTNKMTVRPAKTQISLGIRSV